jgi:hypothetical protein
MEAFAIKLFLIVFGLIVVAFFFSTFPDLAVDCIEEMIKNKKKKGKNNSKK